MIRSRLRMRGGGSGGGSPPAFAPTDISGLQLWLDASDAASITHSLNAVSQWNDKSGNARHVTQGSASNQPTTNTGTINSLNAINFDGSNDLLEHLTSMGGILGGDNTFFFVAQADTSNEFGTIMGANYGDQFIVFYNNTNYRYHHRDSGALPYPGEAIVFNTPNTSQHILLTTRTGTSEYRLRLDGGSGSVNNGGATNVTTSVFQIGAQNTGFRQFDGRIGEIAAYNRVLTTSELNQMGTYLAAKWGITWTNI